MAENPRIIDLRSDTITRPCASMRAAMAAAEVGDDVYVDDPTVNSFEALVAELLGKEAALFVPSGTMSNQIALRTHCRPGDWIMASAASHILNVEGAITASLSGLAAIPVSAPHGHFLPDAVDAALPVRHYSVKLMDWYRPRLLSLENTHNAAGGTVWPLAQLSDVCARARAAGMAVHLDGARLWNAAIATGVSVAEIAAPFDTVSVCFSKGLGAPIGSALVGSREHIANARRLRSHHGGAMRQVGVIAAAARYALENNFERLAEDHVNAKRLADGLADLPGLSVDAAGVQTNIVRIETGASATEVCDRAAEVGVRMLPLGRNFVRAVTCSEVTAVDIDEAVARLSAALA